MDARGAAQEERHANIIRALLAEAPLAIEPMPPEYDQTA